MYLYTQHNKYELVPSLSHCLIQSHLHDQHNVSTEISTVICTTDSHVFNSTHTMDAV